MNFRKTSCKLFRTYFSAVKCTQEKLRTYLATSKVCAFTTLSDVSLCSMLSVCRPMIGQYFFGKGYSCRQTHLFNGFFELAGYWLAASVFGFSLVAVQSTQSSWSH